MNPARLDEEGLGVSIASCQSVTESGGVDSGEMRGSIGARYQRWMCCSAVARLCFECLVASVTGGAVLAKIQRLRLGYSIGDCLVQPVCGQTR